MTMLVECVRVDARTVLLVLTVINLVMGNILVEIVPRNAPITVNRTHVDRQTDCVLVLQDGQVIIVAQLVSNRMENIVGTPVVCIAIIIHVTKSMEDASSVVKMDFIANYVIKKI